MQRTWLAECDPLIQCRSFSSRAWQPRHTPLACSGERLVKATIFLTSPPPATWRLPFPWQSSHSTPCCLWKACWKFLETSPWQLVQVSEPTDFAPGTSTNFANPFARSHPELLCPGCRAATKIAKDKNNARLRN